MLDFAEESKRFVSRAPERPQNRGSRAEGSTHASYASLYLRYKHVTKTKIVPVSRFTPNDVMLSRGELPEKAVSLHDRRVIHATVILL